MIGLPDQNTPASVDGSVPIEMVDTILDLTNLEPATVLNIVQVELPKNGGRQQDWLVLVTRS